MRIILAIVFAAQLLAGTQVSDTIKDASGRAVAKGSITFTPTGTFPAAANWVDRSPVSAAISGGAFSVVLEPTPAGVCYSVTFQPSSIAPAQMAYVPDTLSTLGLGDIVNAGNCITSGEAALQTVPGGPPNEVMATNQDGSSQASATLRHLVPADIPQIPFTKVGGPGGSGALQVTGGVPELVSGAASDCVKVDGSSGPCGTGGGSSAWGGITGDIADQADLQAALAGKQAALGYVPLNPANNLSDIASASAARASLGLGGSATLGVGMSAGTVAAGDDSRLSDSRAPTAHATTHKPGGSDPISTATPTANAIPQSGAGGTLDPGWIPTLNQNTTGNAGTASALAANPTDCGTNQYANAIAASGNLTCSQVAYSQVTGTPSLVPVATSGSASDLSTGTVAAARGGAGAVNGALKGNGSGAVSQAACADLSNAAASCSIDTTNASNIGSGTLNHARLPALLSGDIPNNAANTSGNAGTATALAANPTNCSAGNYPLGVDAGGNVENCTPVSSGPTLSSLYTAQGGNYYYPLFQAAGLPDAATWTWLYQPTGATANSVGGHGITLYAPGAAANSLAAMKDMTALGSSSFTLRAGLMGVQMQVNNPGGGIGSGICVTDGIKVITIGLFSYFGTPNLGWQHWTNATTIASQQAKVNMFTTGPLWLQASLASGTLTFSYSMDGSNWIALGTEGVSSFLSAGSLWGCLDANSNQTASPSAVTLLDWSH